MPEPNDRFQQYYLEKLWEMVPPVYRDADGQGEGDGALRGLISILAEQAAIVRRSTDRLWEDQFIDLADDWVVPYIGDLLGTRMVPALDQRGRRVDVANTIYYRRRAGTVGVLEGLTADLTGWEGTVVEEFRRLLRHPHGLDPAPAPAQRVTSTVAHGLPDLRRPRGSAVAWGAWDEYSHLPDVRRNDGGLDGRYAISKLAIHLYRLPAFAVQSATPRLLAADAGGHRRFTFDPSGRTIPLFQRHSRPSFDVAWRAAREWELPAPLRCEVLGNAEFTVTEALILEWLADSAITLAQAERLRSIRGIRFPTESRFRIRLAALISPALGTAARHRLLADALVDDCGKGVLLEDGSADSEAPASVAVHEPVAGVMTPIPPDWIQAGNLSSAALEPDDTRLVIDAENGLGHRTGGTPPGLTVSYSYGFAGSIGAGTYPRSGLHAVATADQHRGGGAIAAPAGAPDVQLEIADSATYGPIGDLGVQQTLLVQAGDKQRPYVELATDWTIRATQPESVLVIDGLWIGARAPRVIHLAAQANCSWASVTISHTTLDPGGLDADGGVLGPITLSADSVITELSVTASILGPLVVAAGGVIETLVLRDTILHSTDPAVPVALSQPRGLLDIRGCTVAGGIHAHRLEASEVLCTGVITVDDLQSGCIRYSAFAEGSEVPRAYRSQTLTSTRGLFTSLRFGDPGYAQLSDVAPSSVVRGGEDGVEIGAFMSLLSPIRFDSLRTKVDEFLPFGLIPLFITET